MSRHTNDLRNFTNEVRRILNTSGEYGFEVYKKFPDLLNCYVTGESGVENIESKVSLIVATIHGRHDCYPSWKLSTYLKLIELVNTKNENNTFEENVTYVIEFTGNRHDDKFQRTFTEMMESDLSTCIPEKTK